jgi:hypothetical protein
MHGILQMHSTSALTYIIREKIYISPLNYHSFSGWHIELLILAFRLSNLLLSDFFDSIRLFIPLILTEIGQKPENTPPLIVRISKCRRGIFEILFRIDGINGRMEPKNQKVVV